MLGRTGALYMQPVKPSLSAVVFKPVLLNGIGMMGRLAGLGDAIENTVNQATTSAVDATAAAQQTMTTPGLPATSTAPAASVTGPSAAGAGMMMLMLLSGLASAVHGWKRDHTPISAFGWFTLGSMFPIITPTVAIAQGYGKRRRRGR